MQTAEKQISLHICVVLQLFLFANDVGWLWKDEETFSRLGYEDKVKENST